MDNFDFPNIFHLAFFLHLIEFRSTQDHSPTHLPTHPILLTHEPITLTHNQSPLDPPQSLCPRRSKRKNIKLGQDRLRHLEAKAGPVQRGSPAAVPEDRALLGGRVLPCGVLRAAEVQRLLPVRVLRGGGRPRGPGTNYCPGKLMDRFSIREIN